MKNSELVFILDRSGSMSRVASDMEGAMQEVIKKQRENDPNILVTYVRFDDEYEEVFSKKPITEIDGFKLAPRGWTALFDAIGKTINSFQDRIEKEESKPERVLFVIITDGEENSSKEFSRDDAFNLINKIKTENKWDVTFIGANQDSIKEGASLGVSAQSSLNFECDAKGIRSMTDSLSAYSCRYFKSGSANYDDNNDSN
ncbi:MAG: vWA domain-containing protein [Clostridia bacterium]|jgi:uncharacterized protein YegL